METGSPPFANFFIIKIDNLLRELPRAIAMNNEDPVRLYKRFLDGIFLVWRGSVEELQLFLKLINLVLQIYSLIPGQI